MKCKRRGAKNVAGHWGDDCRRGGREACMPKHNVKSGGMVALEEGVEGQKEE